MRRSDFVIANEELLKAVHEGLSQHPKALPSWLFYDAEGDTLFQQIMQVPEYYPTRCEFEILEMHKEDLARYFSDGTRPFKIIELGAGDGRKTEVVLRHFVQEQLPFTYCPIDISGSVLLQLTTRLTEALPELSIEGMESDYFDALAQLEGNQKKVVLFLGANIGNYSPDKAKRFLSRLSRAIHWNDHALIGFDLKKDPSIIARAYNDPQGVTRQFNLNLLRRLNREAGANFQIDKFSHFPVYNPETGAAKSYLVSLTDQSVYFQALDHSFDFGQWETIFTEVSQKYDLLAIERLLSSAGLEIVDVFFDHQHYFCDVLVRKSHHVPYPD